MGAQAQRSQTTFSFVCLSHSARSNGPHESNEGHESHEGWHDCNPGIQLRCRDNWLEVEGREGGDGGAHRARRGGAEEDWLLQTRWRVEHEAEEEASDTCPQGRQPVYQGTLCLQGQTCVEDREGPPDEEAQGDDQLSSVACFLRWGHLGLGGRSHQAQRL